MTKDCPQPDSHPARGFWASPCGAGTKCVGMAVLVACFVVQTWLVYSDPSTADPLTGLELDGRKVWQKRNCQVCHQLYGFGGFLGPDLTNVTSRVKPARIERLLTEGSGAMPAFHLPMEEKSALYKFLQAMNKTGIGQPKIELPDVAGDPSQRMLHAIREEARETDSPHINVAMDLFDERGCRECHLPTAGADVGAANILAISSRLTRDQVMEVLRHGQPPIMPPQGLTRVDRYTLYELFVWLGQHRTSILQRAGLAPDDLTIDWSDLPWWEYR